MLFALSLLSSKNKPPVFFITGTTGVSLYGDIDENFDPSCPSGQHLQIWENFSILEDEHLSNCLVKYLAGVYDPETQSVHSPPGVNLYVDEIGAQGSCIATTFLRKTFKEAGYSNFLVVPYDWSRHIYDHKKPGGLFANLKAKIEEKYGQSRTPVTIIGFSMGTLITNLFVSQYVTPQWRSKFISKLVLIAPALPGSSVATKSLLGAHFSNIDKASDDVVRQNLGRISGLLDLLPNYHVYGNTTLAIGPDKEIYVASNLTKAYQHFGTFEGDVPNIFAVNEPVLQTVPYDINVPTLILYNSAIETDLTFNFSEGWDKRKIIKTTGDGTVPDIGPKWLCNNFKQAICKDIKCTKFTFLSFNVHFEPRCYQ